jgi:hypothetical protein
MRSCEALVGACACACATAAFPPPLHAAEPPHHAAEPPLPPITEARPPPLEALEPKPVPWEHHIEVGAGPIAAEMPVHLDGDGNATKVRFQPGPGFNIDLSWQVFRYLRFTAYLYEHDHAIVLPPGWSGIPGTIDAPHTHFYSFGARVSPTLPIGSRVKLWLTAGGGFGYVGYGRFTAGPLTIYQRSGQLFEIPLGLGGSVEIIPRWLSVRVELTGAIAPSQIGDALQHGQYIDGNGYMHDLLPMPSLDAVFVQTVGLALHL